MSTAAKTFKPKNQNRLLVRRPTALGLAFEKLSQDLGLDTSNVKVPAKYEPAISTPPAPKRRKKR